MNTDKFKSLISHLCLSAFICGSFLLTGCGQQAPEELVLYTSVDQPYAQPIVEQFQKDTGIKVRLVTDTEASKSVGLAERLRAEKANPQCDVWWGNEPFHTINLASEGLLQPYDSPTANDIKAMYRDPDRKWAGNGLRARVIGVSDRIDLATKDLGLKILASESFKGRIAMARPTAGTTGGHVAAIYVLWGEQEADAYFRQLRANEIKLLGGNGPVAETVGRGQASFGLTDNDDIAATQREGGSLTQFLPDQGTHGTLMIPTTIGLVTGTKQTDAAKKLIDYLLSPQVEQKLIEVKFSGWSVRQDNKVKAMELDYRQVAKAMPQAVRRATALLEGREQ